MPHTLESQSQQHNNNYTALEATYHEATSSDLVLDPYRSVFNSGPELTLSASVVIPAWNASDTLEQCLIAIEQSTFNRKHQERLEVVVVDDGSTDGTWELLQRMRLNVRLKGVRQGHHSRAHTQNTGIAVAEGDVIVCCDADMILTPFCIEEMVRRHQVLDRVMLVGFRGDVQRDDPRIQPEGLREHLPRFLPPFERDVRLNYGVGWPESMCRDTDHLKRLGEGKHLIMPDGVRWTLANMVFGALFSLARRDFTAMDGYDERFYGWGCEDTLVGVRALALENYIIPVYPAAGLHIAHGDRSARKWQEFAANRRVFQAILRTPFTPGVQQWLVCANRRVNEHFEHAPYGSVENDASLTDVFTEALADSSRRGKYLYALGRFDEAAAAFAGVRGSPEEEAWAQYDQGKTLRVARQGELALPLLEEAARRLPESVWPPLELALTRAMQGDYALARAHLEGARQLDPTNNWVRFLYEGRHVQRAEAHAQQGDYALAACDYEAALVLDSANIVTRTGYATALASAGRSLQAQRVLAAYDGKDARNDRCYTVTCMKLAEQHLARQEFGAAKHVLELARRCKLRDQEVMKLMATIHTAAAQAHPLPLPRDIIKRIQAIPGWLWDEEAELLIALTLRAAAKHAGDVPVLVEIGSYCGRATVAMGLAARSIGRDDVRIVSVDEPSIGPAPGGGSAREVLRSQLAEHDLATMVIYVPEEEATPWLRSSQLVLVDGRHDYAGVSEDVAKYASHIAPGGFLVFHDYADYCPDVQRFINELLIDETCPFEFVAHADTLIAFARRAGTTDEHVEQYFVKRAPPVPSIWMYWEGPMPAYIELCYQTVLAHNKHVRLLNRAMFDELFIVDRDINIDQLALNHKSDFVRAYLLKHYGGLYLDADCIVMCNLEPLLTLTEQADYVGYCERQGTISAGLMVSVAHGEVITEHYRSVCERIRQGGPFEWLDLGAWPLARALAKYPQRHHLVPTEMIMPIYWGRSEEFCIRRSDTEHESFLQRDALCYMLANNTIKGNEQTRILTTLSKEELLRADYFLSFLFRRALNEGFAVKQVFRVKDGLPVHLVADVRSDDIAVVQQSGDFERCKSE